MRTLFSNELLKTFLKWRTFIGFIAVGTVIPLVEIGLRLRGGISREHRAGTRRRIS